MTKLRESREAGRKRLTIIQPSVVAAVDNLPVVIDADQVIISNVGEV